MTRYPMLVWHGSALLALFSLYVASSVAQAHEPSRSLLTVIVDQRDVRARVDVSLRDLEEAIGLDANGDFAVSWGELKRRRAEVIRYVGEHLSVRADGEPCSLEAHHDTVDVHGGATYAVVELDGACPSEPRRFELDYSLLFDVDSTHRGLLQIKLDGFTTTAVLSASQPSFAIEADASSRLSSFVRFVDEGVLHIVQGYDHLAFLALLVLPAVLGRGAVRSSSARAALWELARIVTAFTAAHSLTLGLAVVGVVDAPAAAVEVVIALSVLVAALLNLLPVPRLGWRLALGFGLIHGFGFANALSDLGADGVGMVVALGGFNLGVEVGQIAVVALALLPLFALRKLPCSSGVVVHASSVGCVVLAVHWLVERL